MINLPYFFTVPKVSWINPVSSQHPSGRFVQSALDSTSKTKNKTRL